jgi:cell division protease FtsH
VDRAYERARDVLETHRDRLDALAQKLIAEETVDSDGFESLFKDLPPKEPLHGLPPRPHDDGSGPAPEGAEPSSGKPGSAPTPAPNPA